MALKITMNTEILRLNINSKNEHLASSCTHLHSIRTNGTIKSTFLEDEGYPAELTLTPCFSQLQYY